MKNFEVILESETKISKVFWMTQAETATEAALKAEEKFNLHKDLCVIDVHEAYVPPISVLLEGLGETIH